MQDKIKALSDAYEYINNLENGIVMISDNINSGNEEKGIGLIPLICDGVDWLTQVIKLTRGVHKKEITVCGLNEQFSQIIEALENEDYILVGDLFNYEVIPVLKEIQQEIQLNII